MADTSGSRARSMRKPSRASGSSSTSNAVNGMCLQEIGFVGRGDQTAGQDHSRHHAALRLVFDGKASRIAVELLEARAGVREADAASLALTAGGEPRTVVLNFHLEHAVHMTSADPKSARRGTTADAVPDRILDDRLQNHLRNGGVENFGAGGDFNPQPVLEPHLFDPQI